MEACFLVPFADYLLAKKQENNPRKVLIPLIGVSLGPEWIE
jgi:hypothetical protein